MAEDPLPNATELAPEAVDDVPTAMLLLPDALEPAPPATELLPVTLGFGRLSVFLTWNMPSVPFWILVISVLFCFTELSILVISPDTCFS
ncbi:hypothetical protein D3C81_1852010 [compost metagenome]